VRQIRLIDTAGMRKKRNVVEKLEKLSVADARRAVDFAEVVVLLLDATKGSSIRISRSPAWSLKRAAL
jgi:GTP-binding protein